MTPHLSPPTSASVLPIAGGGQISYLIKATWLLGRCLPPPVRLGVVPDVVSDPLSAFG